MFCAMNSKRRAGFVRARYLILPVLLTSLSACANLAFKRDTETSGTFSSSGVAFTIFAVDIPKGALQIARENASDANMANMVVEEVRVFPYFGPLDWLLDIISVRYASITGTWGFSGRESKALDAKR